MSARQLLYSRLKAGRSAGLKAAGWVFGIPATVLKLLNLAGPRVLLGLGGLAVLAGVTRAYTKGRGQILPINLIDEVKNSEAPYTCGFCTEATLGEACELTRPHYRHEYVPGEQAETWRAANPRAFVHLLNRDGDLCASFGVLALTESFTDQFLQGNVTDLQLKGADVLDFERSKRASRLYISGVVVREPDTHLGHKRTAVMLWAMLRYLEQLYGVRRQRTLYALAITKTSEVLLKKLGFTISCQAKDREDRANLYCYALTPKAWKPLKTKMRDFGDASSNCKCNFQPAGGDES